MTRAAVGVSRTGRRPPEEWAEIERRFRAGETQDDLAEVFGGEPRNIYAHMHRFGFLTEHRAARARRGGPGDDGEGSRAEAPCRALGDEATLGEAAAAAAQSAIRLVKELNPGRAYTWARLAGQLERLARAGGPDGAALGEDPTEPGRRAALDFLRREGVL